MTVLRSIGAGLLLGLSGLLAGALLGGYLGSRLTPMAEPARPAPAAP